MVNVKITILASIIHRLGVLLLKFIFRKARAVFQERRIHWSTSGASIYWWNYKRNGDKDERNVLSHEL